MRYSSTRQGDPSCRTRLDPNDRSDQSKLEHYWLCLVEGLRKGVPKQKSLTMVKAVQQKPNKDPSEFLERIHQT